VNEANALTPALSRGEREFGPRFRLRMGVFACIMLMAAEFSRDHKGS